MQEESNRQRVILVAGHQAAGKTTYSRMLERAQGAYYECLDEQRYQAAKDAGLDPNKDDWGQVLAAMKAAENDYFPRMQAAIKDTEHDLVVIERPFAQVERILPWRDAVPPHRDMEIHFLFTPDMEAAIHRDLKRSYPDEVELSKARESGHLTKGLHQLLEYHCASPRVMEACVKQGLHVKLIENALDGDNGYRVVAEAEDGELSIRNKRSYETFQLRKHLRTDVETAQRISDSVAFGEAGISHDGTIDIFNEPRTRTPSEVLSVKNDRATELS